MSDSSSSSDLKRNIYIFTAWMIVVLIGLIIAWAVTEEKSVDPKILTDEEWKSEYRKIEKDKADTGDRGRDSPKMLELIEAKGVKQNFTIYRHKLYTTESESPNSKDTDRYQLFKPDDETNWIPKVLTKEEWIKFYNGNHSLEALKEPSLAEWAQLKQQYQNKMWVKDGKLSLSHPPTTKNNLEIAMIVFGGISVMCLLWSLAAFLSQR